ncbi:MAG TPA: NifU family protein [Candidatus Elarobacter sp.]|jgi:Fe-S cluster biogenesis protein NfuA|nr:NifU family protein [Candidatus Elarobacter sp.]
MLARDDAPADAAGAEDEAALSCSDARDDASLRRNADRVESLLRGFDAVSTPRQARELGEELARTLVSLYGAGLERVLTVVHETLDEKRSEAVFARLCEDPFVESLLCLHGLHPLSVEERVQRALDGVRPYLKSHEGGVEIATIEDDVVVLRLEGTCDGCPSSEATVKLAVERAILDRVPEIRSVRAESAAPLRAEGPECTVGPNGTLDLISIPLGV